MFRLLFFSFLFLLSCNISSDNNKIQSIQIVLDQDSVNLKLYHQNGLLSDYTEEKAILPNSTQNSYTFHVDTERFDRFRVDFDNLMVDKVEIKKIYIKSNSKTIVLEGEQMLGFFKFNESIEVTINDNKKVLLYFKDKIDPFFVSKSLNTLSL